MALAHLGKVSHIIVRSVSYSFLPKVALLHKDCFYVLSSHHSPFLQMSITIFFSIHLAYHRANHPIWKHKSWHEILKMYALHQEFSWVLSRRPLFWFPTPGSLITPYVFFHICLIYNCISHYHFVGCGAISSVSFSLFYVSLVQN